MEDLYIERVEFYNPEVHFNFSTGACLIQGESALEDTVDFYQHLTSWIEQFLEIKDRQLTVNVKLTYLNTSSIRAFLDLFSILKEHIASGKAIEINWLYQEPDLNEIKTEGEDLANIINVPINLIPYGQDV